MTAQADDGKSTFDLGAMIKNSVNKALNKNGIGNKDGAQGNANGSSNYLKLTDTKLKDILKAYPVKDDANPPAFPKLAIRITGYSKTLDQWSNRTNTPNECVNYNVTLWMNERKAEKFENLRMCATDLAYNISFISVRSPWPAKMNYNKSSGQVRDDGPVAPSKPYPNDPIARSFMYGGGVYYIGSMFIQMGYDWDYPHDTMRVWVSEVSNAGDGSVVASNNAGASAIVTSAQAPAGTNGNESAGAESGGAYPAVGIYDASDRNFERTFTVKSQGKFELVVQQKGKSGNLHSGIGEGQLADAPGGWQSQSGNCKLTVRRGSGSVALHAERCASEWGDVIYDGQYQFKGGQADAKDAGERSKTVSADTGSGSDSGPGPGAGKPAAAGNRKLAAQLNCQKMDFSDNAFPLMLAQDAGVPATQVWEHERKLSNSYSFGDLPIESVFLSESQGGFVALFVNGSDADINNAIAKSKTKNNTTAAYLLKVGDKSGFEIPGKAPGKSYVLCKAKGGMSAGY